MPETISIKRIGEEVLDELQHFNKQVWDAVSFRLIHAMMVKEGKLENSYVNVQEHRKERWQRALVKSKGNKRKAYELVASGDFI